MNAAGNMAQRDADHISPLRTSETFGLSAQSLKFYALQAGFGIFLVLVSRVGLDFIPSLTQAGWLAAYALTGLAVLQQPNLYLALLRRNLVLIAAGAFSVGSALWSLTPALSVYSGTLLLLNIFVGFALAETLGLRRIIISIFFYCLITQVISIVLIKIHASMAYDVVGNAKGIYLHKNAMALNAGILYLTAATLFTAGWRRKLSAVAILVAFISLFLSQSGTGFIMALFTTCILAASISVLVGRRWFLFVSGIALIGCAIAVAAILVSGFNVESSTLGALGKDATLSGRTLLWDQAIKSFLDYPWLGVGYFSFWYSPETAATSIWINMNQVLLSFHNVYLDRLVDVGIIGLSLFIAFMITVLWRSWQKLVASRSAIWIWPFAYTCFIAVDGLTEFPIFWNSELQLMLSIVAAATCGFRLESDQQ